MTFFTISDHIFFGLLVFALPLFAIWFVKPQAVRIPSVTSQKIQIYWANSIILWIGAAAVCLSWYFGGHEMRELGFRPPVIGDFPEWLPYVMFFFLLYLFDTFVSWNESEENPAMDLLPRNGRELVHFSTVVSLSAAICEEVVFRGFIITYLLAFLGPVESAPMYSVLISALVFGIVHAYQGWAALLKIALLSVIFAVIFILSKSLVVLIAIHFLVDFAGGLLSVMKQRMGTSG